MNCIGGIYLTQTKRLSAAAFLMISLTACSGTSPSVTSGGSSSTGGASATATGGESSAMGGALPATGGASGQGGASLATGGASPAAGGATGKGGTSSATGGAPSKGGTSSATGGASGKGGTSSATGGASGKGGTSSATGGASGKGGSSPAAGGTIGSTGGAPAAVGGSTSPGATCDEPEVLADTSKPDHVVGTGLATSCTEAALRSAVEAGGIVTFACGDAPFVFRLTDTLRPARQTCNWANNGPCSRANTVVDGGGKITLDGQGKVRPITFNTEDSNDTTLTLRIQRLKFVEGNSVSQGSGASCETDTAAGGGAVYLFGGNLIAIDCDFENNQGPPNGSDVAGGAIYNRGLGTTTVIRSSFQNNTCATGGAIGVLASTLRIYNSYVSGNKATGDDCGGNGGGVYQDGRGNQTAGKGSTLTVCGTTFSGNTSTQFGGAFFRTAYGTDQTSNIDRSTFSGNTSGNFAGALYLQGTPITLANSTISNNEANGWSLYAVDHNGSGYTAPGRLDMTNVTITGNHNVNWGPSAVQVDGASSGTWQNVTITGNIGDKVTQAISVADEASVTITNSILQECNQTVTGSHNLQWPSSNSACTSNITFSDPQLGSLADNGGATQTMAPAAGSPAAGKGSACATTDQRGVARAAACTLGAYELE